jgi:epoxyqueuosine reductase
MPVDSSAQSQLRTRLHELGFDVARFAGIDSAPGRGQTGLDAWLGAGMHADMQWMERSRDKRLDPTLVLPGARSIIMLGVNYWQSAAASSPGGARWARYALYSDYHDTIEPALATAGRTLEAMFGITGTDYRYYVDTGPVLERGWAARAGLGFVGKNAMLISRDFGNWLFLAAIVTRLEFAPDEPIAKRVSRPLASRAADETGGQSPVEPEVGLLCGKCTRCVDACPTDAFAKPGVVDARRCISYQTIENKGVIPRELRAGIGERIYGCDVCLEVCPWNRFAQEGRRLLLASRTDVAELSLREILSFTPERFAEVFRRTPIKRLKLVGLLRNACIVAGNRRDAALAPELIRLASSHPLPLVRAHAVWAVYRLGQGAELAAARRLESDPVVLAEYAAEEASAP